MDLGKAIEALRAAVEMAALHGGDIGEWIPQGAREVIECAMMTAKEREQRESRRQRNTERMRAVRERAQLCASVRTVRAHNNPPSLPPASPDPSRSPAPLLSPTPPYNPTTPSPTPAPSTHQHIPPQAVVVAAHAREAPTENPTTPTSSHPPLPPNSPEFPESNQGAPHLSPPSARQDQESPPRSAPPPPPAWPAPGHLRQQPRGPAWDPALVSAADADRLREASLRRLLDPAAWLVSVAAYLRDKGDPSTLERWEGLVQAERIAEAVAALEITGQQPRGAWDAYAKKLLLEAMAGGRSLAQERAAPARASPAQEVENLSPGQRMRRYAEKIGHPAAFATPPPPQPDEGPIIDVEAG